MTITITLTGWGSDVGPFSLYSDTNAFTTPFATGVLRSSLIAGYTTLAPDGTNSIEIKSTGVCTNSIYVSVVPYTTTTSTSSTSTTTTCAPLIGVIHTILGTDINDGDCIEVPAGLDWLIFRIDNNGCSGMTISSVTLSDAVNWDLQTDPTGAVSAGGYAMGRVDYIGGGAVSGSTLVTINSDAANNATFEFTIGASCTTTTSTIATPTTTTTTTATPTTTTTTTIAPTTTTTTTAP